MSRKKKPADDEQARIIAILDQLTKNVASLRAEMLADERLHSMEEWVEWNKKRMTFVESAAGRILKILTKEEA
jgi:hypothetical protein